MSCDLEQVHEELQAANERVVKEREMTVTLEEQVVTLQTTLTELRDSTRERSHGDRRGARPLRYHALETEHVKWEAHVVEQLEIMKCKLEEQDVGEREVFKATAKGQMRVVSGELEGCKMVITKLEKEKGAMCLEAEELRADVALLRAKLRCMEPLGEVEGSDSRSAPEYTVLPTVTDSSPPLRADAPAFKPTVVSSSVTTAPLPVHPHSAVVAAVPGSSTVVATTSTTPVTVTTTGPKMAATLSPSASMGSATVVTAEPVTSHVLVSAVGCAAPLPTPGIFPTSTNFLPQIHQYYGGEQKHGETFQDWLEHFEAVSQLARWDDYYKLVYLTTSLRGTATCKSFFTSCSHTQ